MNSARFFFLVNLRVTLVYYRLFGRKYPIVVVRFTNSRNRVSRLLPSRMKPRTEDVMHILKCRSLVRIADCSLSLLSLLSLLMILNYTMNGTLQEGRAGLGSFQDVSQRTSRELQGTGSTTRQGKFVSHLWEHLCGSNLLRLTKSPMFPKYPDVLKFVSNTSVKLNKSFYGQRIFGFLHPPETGFYKFILYSDDASEFWLSLTVNLSDVRLLARVGSRDSIASASVGEIRFQSQISESVFLQVANKYPVEILHYQGQEVDFVELQWIRPGKHSFEVITAEYMSHGNANRPLPLPVRAKELTKNATGSLESKFYLLASLPDSIHSRALQKCDYVLSRQELIGDSFNSHSKIQLLHNVFRNRDGKKDDRWRNDSQAKTVVDLYMKELDRIFPR